jgi:phenylalanyl-tRNA synthetase beta chain
MKVSYNWLKEFIDLDASPEEVAYKLTLSGSEVENIEVLGSNLDKIVVGEIKKLEKHPQAEKLSICQVDIGNEIKQIICAAANIRIKQKAATALVGATLPGGLKIEKATLRGVDSYGMLCSEKELCLGEDSEGIMVLDSDSKVGQKLSEALDLSDFVFDIALTPNRADCLSILGIAREVAALFDKKLRKPEINLTEIEEEASSRVKVTIDDPLACPRYVCRIIRDVKIEPLPFWIKRRLMSCGIRSINNVVDVTNYVMLELGHPLHAFDFDLFPQAEVLVRRAKKEECFITLDQVERKLNPEILLITDGKKPVAIAGIMGGLESEVSDYTKNVLLESAYFDPKVIRRGRLFLGISSESSQRFERGTDPNNASFAADRAAFLIQKMAKGEVLKNLVDNYPKPIAPVKIGLREKRVNQILGTELNRKQIRDFLQSLELNVSEGTALVGKENDNLEVEIPTFRPDLTREIDLIEEVARIYGYDGIKTSLRAGGNLVTFIPPEEKLLKKVKEILVGLGFFEVITNNLVDPKSLEKLSPDKKMLLIENPLSEDLSALRTTLIHNLLNIVSHNKKRKEAQVRIFELNKIFLRKGKGLPQEKYKLTLALSGSNNPLFWGEEEKPVDLFSLKGAVESLLESLSIPLTALVPKENPVFPAGGCFEIRVKDTNLGVLGEVSEDVLTDFHIKDRVYMAELDFETLFSLVPQTQTFQDLPKFPPVDRDIALVLDEQIFAGDVMGKIRKVGKDSIESLSLFDCYRGKQIPAGKKSLAFAIRYRSKEKTLTDEEVAEIHSKITELLEKEFNAKLRE